ATGGPQGVDDQRDADGEDRQAQHHAHREPAAIEVADLDVGQAEELDEDAAQRIADAEYASDEARMLQGLQVVSQEGDDDEEHDALEQRFVELAGMAWELLGIGGKDDAPGERRRRAVELGVNEVGNAAEEEADAGNGAEQVERREDVAALGAGEEGHG